MSTVIKNGKLHFIDIWLVKLISITLLFVFTTVFTSSAQNNKKWVIVIDAGHGGKDPGALGAFSREKDIVLAIALKTGEYIEKYIPDVSVIYTRKTDTLIDIRDRADIANKNDADLFISIHANWSDSKNARGTETFIMGTTKEKQNLEVAMKENEVILLEKDYSTKYEDFDPRSPESYVMFTLTQNIYREQSTNLAAKIQSQYRERVNRRDRGVKQAGFWVIFMTTMPSVLTETGFITNPSEEAFLNSKEGQEYIASAIFRACRDYINEINSKTNISFENVAVADDTMEPSEEIIFMVQITTSSSQNELTPDNFNGLKDVMEIRSQERYKYASGRFNSYQSAVRYRKEISDKYPDAFVIAIKDNKILPLQEALDLQNSN